MVPIRGEWTPFADINDQLEHYRLWGLIPPKSKQLRPIMVVDGYFGIPEPCEVVGYQRESCAVIKLSDGYHAIQGEYLADLQPVAHQRLPFGTCFTDILSKYVVFDLETTGRDRHNDRIIEISAIYYEYGNRISEFSSLINPEKQIPANIVKLTGITQEDVSDAPLLEEIAPRFLAFIGEYPLVGHNALTFDISFLSAQLGREIQNQVIDTLPMAREAFNLLPHHNLEYLNNVLGLGSTISHRALADVETTNALLWACLAPRRFETRVNRAMLDARLSGCSQKRETNTPSGRTNAGRPKNRFEKIDIKSISPSCACVDTTSPLCGKSIVFTGTLSISREEAMQLAVNAGAVLKNSVSSRTGYLVVGKQDIMIVGMYGISLKEATARKLNAEGKAKIQILSEDEFLSLVRKEGAFT